MRQTPLQNRVTPFGDIIATPERGTFTGNRGCIHRRDRKELTGQRWTTTRWITCLLEFQGRRRELMAPGLWTELFFLDEPTALAAGHRPCAFCRRADYNRFMAAWSAGNPALVGAGRLRAETVDAVLHRERVGPAKQKVTFEAHLNDLPDATMVVRRAAPITAWLLRSGQLLRWSSGGYVETAKANPRERVAVLTPRSTVNALASGYQASSGAASDPQSVPRPSPQRKAHLPKEARASQPHPSPRPTHESVPRL